mgnify:CR=1 FL=1
MDHDFFEMYLEELGAVIPLSESEKRIVLEGSSGECEGSEPSGRGKP